LPFIQIISFPFNWLGVIFLLVGIVLNLWTDNIIKKNQTTVKPTEIPSKFIVKGPYKVSRHPMYLGMLLILLGISSILNTAVGLIPVLLFIVIIEKIFIPIEEKNLSKAFQKEYNYYKNKVRKWI
jgi:protein-S-isoprenylcysteine O-methyltransferase Ste14